MTLKNSLNKNRENNHFKNNFTESQIEKDYYNKTYPAVLAKLMYQNARRIGMDIDALTESESVVSAMFGHYCHCNRMAGGRQKVVQSVV